ncbi:hypothetical protein [Acinetobacter modestus]|uniref:hypothetical protein n=1 Tax=Acinetobacter modestus TaxID=1776740 RepID=UPI001F4B05DF|nr:hypothetical protein [Acinetobacter modestus]MCH7329019.1 hypothetical protein [Acinetobacter modestus]
MKTTEELKELETGLKKIDINLSIWIMIRFMCNFRKDFDLLFKKPIHVPNEVIYIIRQCETLIDIRKKVTLLILDLPIDLRYKKDYLKELNLENPDSELKRILKIIHNDKRLADFIYYNLEYESHIKFNPLLGTTISRKKIIFHEDELIRYYSNNSPLQANFNLVDLYIRENNYKKSFNNLFRELNNIKKISKTVIGNNIENKEFSEWLFEYIEKNIILASMTSNTTYVPYTSEERKNFMLHQLDVWYLLDPNRYDQVLKKIQSAWHKKAHDARKRSLKLNSIRK